MPKSSKLKYHISITKLKPLGSALQHDKNKKLERHTMLLTIMWNLILRISLVNLKFPIKITRNN